MAETSVPLALYVHLPWCVKKCPYCDFNSHALSGELDESSYVKALEKDLVHEYEKHGTCQISSIFFGGGTPSLFSTNAFERLLRLSASLWGLTDDVEVTIEANPGAADAHRFRGYRQAGINRISIGVQSFDDVSLKNIGRVHDSVAAFEAVGYAKKAGFDRVNLDLMFGLPNQNMAACLCDVRTAIGCDVTHLSCYQLTLEPNTAFFSQPPPLPDDDTSFEMQTKLQCELASAGFRQYEVSAYAMEGAECRHNKNYWQYGDYIGVGAGAHGKTTKRDEIERRRKLRHPKAFMQHAGNTQSLSGKNAVDPASRVFEFMLNALRLNDGFSVDMMLARTQLDYDHFASKIEDAMARGFISMTESESGRTIRTTALGQRFLNDLTELFLP